MATKETSSISPSSSSSLSLYDGVTKNKPTIIAFVNNLSGGQRGKEVIPIMKSILGDDHVFDLNECGGPENGLKKFIGEPNLRVIACGGDGTIRWVIQGIINVGFDPMPPVGVIPLGTGNDLSREFGWGGGYNGQDLIPIFDDLAMAETKPMDVWNVTRTPWNPETKEVNHSQAQSQIMFNYFNLGYDAQVQIQFHELRNSNPNLFPSRVVNIAWYTLLSFGAYFIEGAPNLDEICEVLIDEQSVLVPKGTKTLVFLNFICYQSGVDIWGTDSELGPPKTDDKLLEVVAIEGFVHEAMIRTGMSRGIRLGRGSQVKVYMNKKKPLSSSFDGEPELTKPSVISVTHYGQVPVLYRKTCA